MSIGELIIILIVCCVVIKPNNIQYIIKIIYKIKNNFHINFVDDYLKKILQSKINCNIKNKKNINTKKKK